MLCYTGAYADDTKEAVSQATVQGVRQHLVGVSNESMKLIMLISAIVGIAYLAMGLFSLKAASDSAGQQNQNLQKGIVKLVLGGALIALPFMMKVSQNSVLNSGMSGTSGISIPNESEAYS